MASQVEHDLPRAFLDRMKAFLGDEYSAFLESMAVPRVNSLRLHPVKGNKELFSEADPVPWYPESGRYLLKRPNFTLDPAFHAGSYFVQEASSMLTGHFVGALLPVDRPWRVLDLCGAPGGKTSILMEQAPPRSIILANEVIASRASILQTNVSKWGFHNVICTQADPEKLLGLVGFFDLVLVDAPCSGEGLFRKDSRAADIWDPELVSFCASRQQRILRAAEQLTAPGGILLYSTCTLNRKENEKNAAWLCDQFEFQSAKPALPEAWNLLEAEFGHYALPHRVRGEGFYLAAFRKTDGVEFRPAKKQQLPASWQIMGKKRISQIPENMALHGPLRHLENDKGQIRVIQECASADLLSIAELPVRKWIGSSFGQWKGDQLIPDQGLAWSIYRSFPTQALHLDKDQALQYLKGNTLLPDPQWSLGWHLVQYEQAVLGWVKVLKNRVNNHYPKSERIKMNLPDQSGS